MDMTGIIAAGIVLVTLACATLSACLIMSSRPITDEEQAYEDQAQMEAIRRYHEKKARRSKH